MRLPVIRHIAEHIQETDVSIVQNTIQVLEHLAELKSIKDQELDVIGELISNMYGAIEVQTEIDNGVPAKEALNGFMKRVMGSIDFK